MSATVRLVDRKTRVVEVLGPEPLGSRRPTDRQLLYQPVVTSMHEYLLFGRPRPVGSCYQADGRTARFIVDEGSLGDELLDKLARYPHAPARPARPYGVRGYLVEG